MTIKLRQSCIRTVKPGDPKFMIQDGFVSATRAGFEISAKCPQEYKQIIATCIDRGWLMPIANVRDSELIWDSLSQ